MSAEGERQLMAHKEALDWKTIAIQQLSASLSEAQTAMQVLFRASMHCPSIICTANGPLLEKGGFSVATS